jgi:predicted oxidoreductase
LGRWRGRGLRAGCQVRAQRLDLARSTLQAESPEGRRAFIEKLEDAIDVREARKVLAQMKRKGEKPIPYEKPRRARPLK